TSTGIGSPEGLANDLQMERSSTIEGFAAAWPESEGEIAFWAWFISISTKLRSRLSDSVQRAPDQPIGQYHEHRHHGKTKGDPGKIAGGGHLFDIGAKSPGSKPGMSPADCFGNYAGIPGPTRCSDRTGYIIWKDCRQHYFAPPLPTANVKGCRSLAEVARE